MPKFTVWVQEASGRGTTHVSSHEAASIGEAEELAVTETLADWDLPEAAAAVLRILGVATGDVKIIEWNDLDG